MWQNLSKAGALHTGPDLEGPQKLVGCQRAEKHSPNRQTGKCHFERWNYMQNTGF